MNKNEVTIVGGGFTGLSCAYELVKKGISVTIVEAEAEVAGLAAAFYVNGKRLDRFYHHWFTNDTEIVRLIDELGLRDFLSITPTKTSTYYANNFFKLSTPWDLLNFTPLSFFDRIRLGVLAIRARQVKNWTELEGKTAHEWLKELGGESVYRIIWEPLLKGKFGSYADQISAVWFWNKIKLRGGSRGKKGEERLAYFKGGFAGLADELASKILELGGRIKINTPVLKVQPVDRHWETITSKEVIISNKVIVTTALPLIADMICNWADNDYIASLKKVQYIGNICLVLEMNHSLSDTYWLNVNDPSFPFVGVIEHTNFERPEAYGDKHIVYLSKYLSHTDPLYKMNAEEFLEYAFPYLKKMFPKIERYWIDQCYLWRARWSQPIVERYYGSLIPNEEGPKRGFYICSMAQVYPEDRGTNYAIRNGRLLALKLAKQIKKK